jgi:hypothetical protein
MKTIQSLAYLCVTARDIVMPSFCIRNCSVDRLTPHEICSPVWAYDFPGCFLESGDDFSPLRVLESHLQISIAALGDWLRLSMSAHCLLRLDTKVKLLDRQFEKRSDRADNSPLDPIL